MIRTARTVASLGSLIALGLMQAGFGSPALAARPPLPIEQLRLPKGFKIEVLAQGLDDARSLARGEKGTIFVGTRGAGKVYALSPGPGGMRKKVIATGLDMPNGVAFRSGSLYVAEVGRILRYDRIEEQLDSPPKPVVVTDRLPKDAHHGWKYIAFGPDGLLYVPVGAPCNICEPPTEQHSTLLRMKPDGSAMEVYARGIRNTVGFDWQPGTGVLFFTDNGRDLLGDDVPPDEIDVAPRPGMNFGYPYCHGASIPDPELGRKHACSEFTPPARELGAHVAALGIRFYTGKMFPPEYRGDALVAEHGSWNRSSKSGYRVMRARIRDGKIEGYEPFIEGWLRGQEAWGRPVDLLVQPDGSVLVSDDQAGAIYRVTGSEKPRR